MSFMSSNDLASYTTLDLIYAIKIPSPTNMLSIEDKQLQALAQLADTFLTQLKTKINHKGCTHPSFIKHQG